MSKFYHVIGLIPEKEILDKGGMLDVDITRALRRPSAHNDIDLLALQQKGESVWASGGGTYLLNQRYLLTVQRPIEARVNPGKFSLFTGRADSDEELLRPELLIRELFEELILYSGKLLYKPVCEKYQDIIDRVYSQLPAALTRDVADMTPLPLRVIELADKTITVTNEGVTRKYPLNFHINQNKEVNILFVLAGQIDLASLNAQDGEWHIENDRIIMHERNIYLYDIKTALGQNISATKRRQEIVEIPFSAMTGHMRYLVESVSGWFASSAWCNRLQANII